jgi:DNA invertase Pin-like site-specific DNA recombinase
MMQHRTDAVFVRKSTKAQDEQAQEGSVTKLLTDIGVTVPDENWFVGVVSRRKVKENAEFNRLMELVRQDKIGTIYVESQDRWGTITSADYFGTIGTLQKHQTRLFDQNRARI